ncbi:hypothetical protein Hanom_Chr13g01196921 [Helianthus anomalus]
MFKPKEVGLVNFFRCLRNRIWPIFKHLVSCPPNYPKCTITTAKIVFFLFLATCKYLSVSVTSITVKLLHAMEFQAMHL